MANRRTSEVVRKHQTGERAIEPWRFKNRKDVSLGDRVYLLLQGKGGPAVIGYGEVAGKPENVSGVWRVPIRFESIVDPTVEVLAGPDTVRAIEGGQRFWRVESSGVRLDEVVASELESLVWKRTRTSRNNQEEVESLRKRGQSKADLV